MINLYEYIERLETIYNTKIEYDKKISLISEEVPVALKELYNQIDGVSFPFGCIFPLEKAMEFSKQKSLQNKWFYFGHDYEEHTIWLCLYKPDAEGRSFNFCSKSDLSGLNALYKDIVEFLEDMRADYDDDPWNEKK
ncbi:MAG: hypothetical protein J6K58_06090 [Lachnospiraceae bacterium]|nr:hypothetical protein [Lachnospiraceae bacterium]